MLPPRQIRKPRRPLTRRGLLRFALRGACWVASVVGLSLGLYLTLRPSGNLNDLWWLPSSVRNWAYYNGQLRNLPAFAALAIPCMILANGRRARRKAILGLAVFVAVTEAAQHFVPSRWCEWQDVAYGWAGLLITWSVFESSFRVAWELRQAMRSPGPVTSKSPFDQSKSPFAESKSPFPPSNSPFPSTLATPPANPVDRP